MWVIHYAKTASRNKGNLVLKEAEAAKWLIKEQLDSVEWLPADVTLIEKIRKEMEAWH